MIVCLLLALAVAAWLGWEIVTAPVACPKCETLLYSAGPCPACGWDDAGHLP